MKYQVKSRTYMKYEYPGYVWGINSVAPIPLPDYRYKVGCNGIVDRWYIPSEAPVIPTGWVYELENGDVVIEGKLSSQHRVEM